MKLIKDKVAKLSFVALLLTVAAAMFYTPAASAHGEKSQAAFMRMRTIHWYDLNWSKEVVKVNDTMTISGKFLVFAGWPETVDKPESAFLNIGIPGPVFIRAGSWIGGQLVPRSVSLELGETYEFKVLLKARRPGDWHVHTMINVEGGGPIIGPGKWVTIEGSMSQFTNPITTLTGQTIDLETYNLGNTYFWHAFWYAIGAAWMIYWMRKPMFIPRQLPVEAARVQGVAGAVRVEAEVENRAYGEIVALPGREPCVRVGQREGRPVLDIFVALPVGTADVRQRINGVDAVVTAEQLHEDDDGVRGASGPRDVGAAYQPQMRSDRCRRRRLGAALQKLPAIKEAVGDRQALRPGIRRA